MVYDIYHKLIAIKLFAMSYHYIVKIIYKTDTFY
jgi:hypothetical protein